MTNQNLLDAITDTGRLIRACEQMRDAESDPARLEIIRHTMYRIVDKYHSLLREMPTDDLLRMSGIDGLARSLAANEAVSRALDAIETPKEEPDGETYTGADGKQHKIVPLGNTETFS